MNDPLERRGITCFGLVLVIAAVACGSEASRPARIESRPMPGHEGFVGGTRLQAVLAVANDGTAMFLHWRDTALGIDCAFEPVDDGFRCVPTTAGGGHVAGGVGDLFADEACTRVAFVAGISDGCRETPVVRNPTPQCARGTTHYRVGERLAVDRPYRKTAAGCEPVPELAGSPLVALEPMTDEAFVAARAVVAATSDTVARVEMHAEDGSIMPLGFYDVAGGFSCSPRQTAAGLRCIPVDVAYGARGAYADAACGRGAGVRATCSVARETVPFVLFDPYGSIEAVHRGGARLSESFTRVDVDACTRNTAGTATYAVGEQVPLASFASASVSERTTPSGLIQTVSQVGDVTFPHFSDGLRAAAFGGHRCTLAATADNAVRCVPELEHDVADYADPACTDPIWQADFDSVALVTGQRECHPAGLPLPRVERVLVGGAEHQGPVYRRGSDGVCTLHEGLPNARQPYRRFAREAPPRELVEMSIVVR